MLKQNYLFSLDVHLAKLTEPVKTEFNFYILCVNWSYCLKFSFMQ